MNRVLRGTYGLADKEEDHAAAGHKKECPPPSSIDEERSEHGPAEIPDG